MNSMIGRIMAVLVVATVTFALAGAVSASEEKKASKKGLMFFEGRITSIDLSAKSVTVKKKDGTMTFQVTDATKIYGKGSKEPIALGKLQAADKVEIEYDEQGGKFVAHRIAEKGVNADKIEKKEKKGK